MAEGLIKQLLEAGVHFGHQTRKWNPKMARYIFGQKKGIYIIDLQKTAEAIETASNFLKGVIKNREMVLFVGTKKQAQDIIKEEAARCSMPYVNQRWLGGMLTNFSTIRKSVNRLKELNKMKQEGIFNALPKKEIASLEKEIGKLEKNLSGIIEMDKLPKAIFVIDPKKEELVVNEANRLGIEVVALVDTNCDPDRIAYPIPGNDDAVKSIKLIISIVADSILEGKRIQEPIEEMKEPAKETVASDGKMVSGIEFEEKIAEGLIKKELPTEEEQKIKRKKKSVKVKKEG
ncbi:MAG: 30S ribosomal protein S2 [Candidatus Omnitrophica bacterium]|nr:30S ribosomal protein S2 [Candidatus Omnitrophota bacterium]